MFWIALKLKIQMMVLNIKFFQLVKKLDAFKFKGVVKSGNSARELAGPSRAPSRHP